jgi:hypothetical protein
LIVYYNHIHKVTSVTPLASHAFSIFIYIPHSYESNYTYNLN